LNKKNVFIVISTHQLQSLLGTANGEDNAPEDTDVVPKDHVDSPHVKEKKQLLQLIQSLQENHDKEIDLMETSYR
jgi:hypothetical protein